MLSSIKINDVIKFEIDDVNLAKTITWLAAKSTLVMDCTQCGTTLLPQIRKHYSFTKEEEFKVSCVHCGTSNKVQFYGDYGFVVP